MYKFVICVLLLGISSSGNTAPKLNNNNAVLKDSYLISAGMLFIQPHTRKQHLSSGPKHDFGSYVSVGYKSTTNWDYNIHYKHFSIKDDWKTLVASGALSGFENQEYSYNIDYNVLDFEVGKDIVFSDSISLGLLGGIRYAALEESWDRSSTSGVYGDPGATSQTDLFGVGLKAGFSPTWTLFNKSFRLFGRFSGSILLGDFDDSLLARNDSGRFFSMLEGVAGIGYTLQTYYGEIVVETGYQYELLDFNLPDDRYFEYDGNDGLFGTVGIRY